MQEEYRNAEEMDITPEEWQVQKLLGEEIRRRREAEGMTRAEMAERMGESYSEEIVSQYESGSVPMEIGPFFAMIEALHADMEEFIPKRLMSRHIASSYMELDEESRKAVDLVMDKFLTAKRATS